MATVMDLYERMMETSKFKDAKTKRAEQEAFWTKDVLKNGNLEKELEKELAAIIKIIDDEINDYSLEFGIRYKSTIKGLEDLGYKVEPMMNTCEPLKAPAYVNSFQLLSDDGPMFKVSW